MENTIVCFEKGTKVLVDKEQEVSIEKIKPGDKILSYNFESNQIEITVVDKIASSYHSLCASITFSNGVSVVCTLDHPFYVTSKGWCSLQPETTEDNYGIESMMLKKGDVCLSYSDNLKKISVIDIRIFPDNKEMHVVSGGNNKCFFANGILVSDENINFLNLEKSNSKFELLNH